MRELDISPITSYYERFALFLKRHLGENFTFLRRLQQQSNGTVAFLDAMNWCAEQAIRPTVVNRKVQGGNGRRAEAQETLTSVLATAAQHTLDLHPQLSRTRTEPQPILVGDAGRWSSDYESAPTSTCRNG